MFIGDPPGNYDRILDFSAAVTGGLFFVPSADFLRHPPGPPGLPTRATAVQPTAVPATAVQPAAVPATAVPATAVREPDLADEPAPPGIPYQPGTAEHVGGLTRSGPAVTIPPRV
jgi:hypothetical protein